MITITILLLIIVVVAAVLAGVLTAIGLLALPLLDVVVAVVVIGGIAWLIRAISERAGSKKKKRDEPD